MWFRHSQIESASEKLQAAFITCRGLKDPSALSNIIAVVSLFEFLGCLGLHVDFVDVLAAVVLFEWKVEISDDSSPAESHATTYNRIEVFEFRV